MSRFLWIDIARQFGTPCYVYSRAALVAAYGEFDAAFAGRDHLVCYAVKANSNLAILNLFARLGSGFDIVSGGELQRVLKAGGDPQKIVFSGVGKRPDEMRAALAAGILCFNVESKPELETLNRSGARDEQDRPGESSGQPGCGRQNASLYFDRSEGKQIWHSL